MFLDAALEYDSVLFRSVALDGDTDLETGLKQALSLDHSLAEIRFHGQEAFTVEGHVQPLSLIDPPDFALNPGEVVVISGGGKGITPHLAYALAPLKPRLVLLGSSELDPEVDYDSLIAADAAPAGASPHRRGGDRPASPADKSDAATRLASGREITQTLKELARQGIEATYYSCDVNDPENVAAVLGRVVSHYGGIAGIIHGAGIIRDSFMEFMTAADFTQVVEVKLLGAWNLYRAAREHGLRFMVMLSSITAVRGNVGQINYCAGNRAMSALAQVIASRQPSVRAKALMLPPIQGAGMADDPELQELMRLKGMGESYISVGELAELFYRELFLGPAQEHWVMPIRTLPPLKTVRLNLEERPPVPGCITAAGVTYRDYELPMIQTIHHLEVGAGTLEAGRTFSLDHDLWMEDHRPFKFMKNPFVSGVMALETFMEAAHLLCPQLVAAGSAQRRIPGHPGVPAGGQPGGPHRLPAPPGERRRGSALRRVPFQPGHHYHRPGPGPLDHQLHRPGDPGTVGPAAARLARLHRQAGGTGQRPVRPEGSPAVLQKIQQLWGPLPGARSPGRLRHRRHPGPDHFSARGKTLPG